jgi:hypothetical protein
VYVAWIGVEPTDILCNLVIPKAVNVEDEPGVLRLSRKSRSRRMPA